jgi:hypothetical protein
MTSSLRIFSLSFSLLFVLTGLSACMSSSRSHVTVQESIKFSKGQELNDLMRAKQAGAVTDSEYESLRQTIMNRPN